MRDLIAILSTPAVQVALAVAGVALIFYAALKLRTGALEKRLAEMQSALSDQFQTVRGETGDAAQKSR